MKFLYSLIISLAIISCSSTSEKKKEDLPALKEEVMKVHDEVMPKMGPLMKAKKELLKKAETETDSLRIMKYLEVSGQIELANESMMDWMHNYNPNFDGDEVAVKEYLNEKKKSIEKVKIDMISALLASEEALKE